MARSPTSHCPCGNLRPYADCCARFHGGERPDTAAQLMRSRYSAYALRLDDYLLDTWHPSTRPAVETLKQDENLRWVGLDIRARQQTGEAARIEFIARYRLGNGPVQQQHEISRFVREGGRWLYVDGEFPRAPAPLGRRGPA